MGFAIIGLALVLFVQANNVFPQLLLARLFFSIGGAATATMVTAILPSMIANPPKQDETDVLPANDGGEIAPSVPSELTMTPHKVQGRHRLQGSSTESSPTKLAGLVGLFTGCGALLALGFFLRLPELIQRAGVGAEQALTDSYYVVGSLALTLSLLCYLGLKHLHGETGKGWRNLIYGRSHDEVSDTSRGASSLKHLFESVTLGFQTPLLGLAYLAGFVARASSVGISLFIPLFVNDYYISSGRCDKAGRNPQDVKDNCQEAYVLAAELTGVSQLIALLFAPVFGYVAGKYRYYNVPLLLAAFMGILGYVGLAVLQNPEAGGTEGSPWIFLLMALLGVNQIGAIVCSLGLLGRCVLGLERVSTEVETPESTADFESHDSTREYPANTPSPPLEEIGEEDGEEVPFLPSAAPSRVYLKGSIAGVYSLAGGIGILILTKLGGMLFDRVSPVTPFYLLALFNGLLFGAGVILGVSRVWS